MPVSLSPLDKMAVYQLSILWLGISSLKYDDYYSNSTRQLDDKINKKKR